MNKQFTYTYNIQNPSRQSRFHAFRLDETACVLVGFES